MALAAPQAVEEEEVRSHRSQMPCSLLQRLRSRTTATRSRPQLYWRCSCRALTLHCRTAALALWQLWWLLALTSPLHSPPRLCDRRLRSRHHPSAAGDVVVIVVVLLQCRASPCQWDLSFGKCHRVEGHGHQQLRHGGVRHPRRRCQALTALNTQGHQLLALWGVDVRQGVLLA